MMDINVDLVQWLKMFLIKKLLVVVLKMRICQTSNQQKNNTNQLLETLRKKVHSPFIDIILVADLADMQLIRQFNVGFTFLLCAIDIHSKYAWVIPLKDKKVITILMLSRIFWMN